MEMKLCPLALALTAAISQQAIADGGQFFADSTIDLRWKVNYYDIEGEGGGGTMPLTAEEVAGLQAAGVLPSGLPVADYDVDISNDMSINDFGTSVWMNWHSGWLADFFAVELEYQGAAIFDQSGTFTSTGTIDLGPFGSQSATIASVDNPYFYMPDADESYIGKLGNANLRFKVGSDSAETQLVIGQFTPTIYDLLHRPDYIYYAMHQVYQGASVQGHYEWSWGMINPWVNYFTGYSNEYNTDYVNFKDDLSSEYYRGSFDEIYNVGFHTVTDYYTSSASYSLAPDYMSNGIIEIYSGIPYSLLGWGDKEGDKDHFIKYMVKYGAESGQGDKNDDHETDVYEFAVGLQHGNLDFLMGVTQIGDESFQGFDTQDGFNAGGGTAVWGDVAILNSFDLANQRTYFLVGGLNLDGFNLPEWRIQGVVANANDTDLSKLSLLERIQVPNEDYTEYNLDIIYAKNGYQGEGMSYLLKIGKDDNYDAFGFGFFVEYNGDITQLLN